MPANDAVMRNEEEFKQREAPAFQQAPPQMQNPEPVMSTAP